METNPKEATSHNPKHGDWPSVEDQQAYWQTNRNDSNFLFSLAEGLEKINVMPLTVSQLRDIARRIATK